MCKALLLVAGFFIILYFADLALNKDDTALDGGWAFLVENQPQKILSRSKIYQTKIKERNLACHFNSDCFDVYRCGANNGKLKGNFLLKYPHLTILNFSICSLYLSSRGVCLRGR